jgi:hypothetical protein
MQPFFVPPKLTASIPAFHVISAGCASKRRAGIGEARAVEMGASHASLATGQRRDLVEL